MAKSAAASSAAKGRRVAYQSIYHHRSGISANIGIVVA